MKRVLLATIRFYQRAISPALPAACRYQPTCSRYAYEAIERHGALRGGFLAFRRLTRCVPWKPGGFDPVPGGKVPPKADTDDVGAIREPSCGVPLKPVVAASSSPSIGRHTTRTTAERARRGRNG